VSGNRSGLLSKLRARMARRFGRKEDIPIDQSAGESYDMVHFLILAPYRLLGDKINRLLPPFQDVEKKLLKANIKITFPAYVAFMVFLSLLAGVLIFASSMLLGLVLGATYTTSAVVAVMLGLSSGLTIFVVLYVYPSMQVDSRKRILDEELPYVASHTAVLSRAGLPPERIFRSVAALEAEGVRSVAAEEARNIVRDVHFLGFDIISAMERGIRNSPSRKFVDFLDGFVSVARSGGDLTDYFLSSAKGFMDSARIAARQLIETLGGLAEAYLSMMVVFPLLIIVMLSVMTMIGGSVAGFSTVFLMQMVTYLLIPALALIMLLLLDSIMPPK